MKQRNEMQIEKLKSDWKQLDTLAGQPSISPLEIKQQIEIYKEKQKKSFRKELLLFFTTAIGILSFFIISFIQVPILFIVIEVSAIIIGPIIFFVLIRSKNKEGNLI